MRYRAQPYTDPGSLLAESLDITLEQLDERPLDDWLAERRLSWCALMARLAAAREDALSQAINDGEINAAEAARLQSESVWVPVLDAKTLTFPSERHAPQYGFLYLHGPDGVLN